MLKGRTRIDTLKTREKMAKILLDRLEQLTKKEAETKESLPETRETISTLNAVLREIRLETIGYDESPEELKNRLFGDWMRKEKEGDES